MSELKYRYQYDEDGFYCGLARQDSLGLFHSRTTKLEPRWEPGFVPRWDFEVGSWRLIKRSEKRPIRYGLELLRHERGENLKVISRELHKFALGHSEIMRDVKALCDICYDQSSKISKLSNLVQMLLKNQVKITEDLALIEFSVKETQVKVFEVKPSLWQRFKNWLGW